MRLFEIHHKTLCVGYGHFTIELEIKCIRGKEKETTQKVRQI